MEQVTLSELFDYLEEEYELLLSYKNFDAAQEEKTIDLNLTANSQEQLFDKLFEQLDLDYQTVGNNQIAITNRQNKKDSDFKCGCILDDLSGEKLAFANVFSADTTIAVNSNEHGVFKIPSNADEDLQLKVSYIGFENIFIKVKDLKDCDDDSQDYTIRLKSAAFEVPYLVIKDYITDGIDLGGNGQSTNLKPRYLSTLPGQTNPDILRSAQFLPGIASINAKASEIYVRGGTPDQNLILWEDIPIYHSAHYFGMVSAVDPFIISKTNIFRSGFDASYGGRIACVMDIKSYGLDDNYDFLGVGTDMINTFINGHQRFGTKKNNSISFSVRRSFADIWESPNFINISKFNQQGLLLGSDELEPNNEDIEIENSFKFTDAHLKFESQISDKTLVSFSGLYAENDFIDRLEDTNAEEIQRDTMNLENAGLSLMLEHKWSDNFKTNIKAIGTNYQYDFNLSIIDTDDGDLEYGLKSNSIMDRQLQLNNSYQFAEKKLLQWGYQFTHYDIAFDNFFEARNSRADVSDADNTQSNLQAGYINFKNPISEIIGINAGIRANYYSETEKFYFEPRLNISYQLAPSFSVHANFGRHYQFISQITEFKGNENGFSTELWALSEDRNIPVQEANQLQAGFIFNKNNWTVDLQAYRKDISGLSSRAYNFVNDENSKKSIGNAEVRGIDLLVKKRINKNLKTWLSYTLSEIVLDFPKVAIQPFNADYDQRHSFKITSQLSLADFDLGVGFNYSSGLPFTRIIDFEIDNQVGGQGGQQDLEIDIDYGPINRNNLSQTMELNISGSYQWVFKNSDTKAILTGSVINLLNRKNVWNRTFFVDTPRNQPARLQTLEKENLPVTPNLSLRFEF